MGFPIGYIRVKKIHSMLFVGITMKLNLFLKTLLFYHQIQKVKYNQLFLKEANLKSGQFKHGLCSASLPAPIVTIGLSGAISHGNLGTAFRHRGQMFFALAVLAMGGVQAVVDGRTRKHLVNGSEMPQLPDLGC